MERSISGKIAVAIALAVFLVAGMAWWWLGASGPGLPTTGQPIKMARYYWPGFYWIEIAQHKGWFKDAGLQVELIDANPTTMAPSSTWPRAKWTPTLLPCLT
jgi:ABC-type nitrate/sulfonate/bicarbonate transport system substrate-binding protein